LTREVPRLHLHLCTFYFISLVGVFLWWVSLLIFTPLLGWVKLCSFVFACRRRYPIRPVLFIIWTTCRILIFSHALTIYIYISFSLHIISKARNSGEKHMVSLPRERSKQHFFHYTDALLLSWGTSKSQLESNQSVVGSIYTCYIVTH